MVTSFEVNVYHENESTEFILQLFFFILTKGPLLFYTTPTAGNLTLGSSGALLNASEHMQTFAKNLEKKMHICLFIS